MSCEPLVKWVGGKRQLLPHLLPLVPDAVKTGKKVYFEPFVGGGVLFFAVNPPRAEINDANTALANTYTAVRDMAEQVIARLARLAKTHSVIQYYRVRAARPRTCPDLAVWLLYLNRTCFNGLWRVNKKGEFNVPVGRYENPTICDPNRIRACARALKNADVWSTDFEKAVETARSGDFVYFDPPYVPLTATSNFTSYGKDGFTDADQVRLRDLALRLKRRGVKVVLSNSSAPRVLELYDRHFSIAFVDARRAVNSDASKRGAVKEVIIT